MFVLYAVPVGLLIGILTRGSLDRLGELRWRWAPLAVAGLLVQAALFTDAVGSAVGGAAPAIYVASSVAVIAAVLRDVRVPGMAIIAIGAVSNVAAILANGGYMPADPAAFAAVVGSTSGYSNSVVTAHPALQPLTDIFALPRPLPFANVFSIGDVLIGAGVAVVIVAAMRGRRANQGPSPGP